MGKGEGVGEVERVGGASGESEEPEIYVLCGEGVRWGLRFGKIGIGGSSEDEADDGKVFICGMERRMT